MARYGRRTLELHVVLHYIGLSVGGRAGALLAQRLGITEGRDTILRGLKRWVKAMGTEKTPVRVVGIDDWAFRKGQRYGTILVDLEGHKVLDLLRDRSVESATEWFREHPEIRVISRDRGGIYAEAGRIGAPQAIQVADRFHLSKNVSEMIQRVLAGEQTQVRKLFQDEQQQPESQGSGISVVLSGQQVVDEPVVDEPVVDQPDPRKSEEHKPGLETEIKSTRPPTITERRRQVKLERFEAVKELNKRGLSITDIAGQLGICRRTATRLARADSFPESSSSGRRPKLTETHRDYLDERWKGGCYNVAKLFRELRELGFKGGSTTVSNYLRQQWPLGRPRGPGGRSRGSPRALAPPSSRQLAWTFLYPEKSLALIEKREGKRESQRQATALNRLMESESALKIAVLLAREFIQMVSLRQADKLDTWIKSATTSGVKELVSFAKGITQDYDAVKAALDSDVSNGQVEGQVNRLKTQKRQMYGQAGVDLLKARLVGSLKPEN